MKYHAKSLHLFSTALSTVHEWTNGETGFKNKQSRVEKIYKKLHIYTKKFNKNGQKN